jgi:hypothetical protein
MAIKWRKINRVVHRDLGYFFTGMILIYALSGIALNHRGHWNPNYIVKQQRTQLAVPANFASHEDEAVRQLVKASGVQAKYKNHYFPATGTLKIFLEGGSSVVVEMQTGEATIESIKKRPLFNEVNFLHYNPGKLWLWFSDIFAVSLALLALSGLFILKGRNGITRRGAWLTAIGLLVPLALLLMYLS